MRLSPHTAFHRGYPRLGPFAPAAFTAFITTMDPLTFHGLLRDLPPSTCGLSNVPFCLSLTFEHLRPPLYRWTGRKCDRSTIFRPSPLALRRNHTPTRNGDVPQSPASDMDSSPDHSVFFRSPAPHTEVTTSPGFTPPGERPGTHAGVSGSHAKIDPCGQVSHLPIRQNS